jgi:outer membrane protein TolC
MKIREALFVLFSAVLVAVPVTASESALERLTSAVESAWQHAPQLKMRESELAGEAAMLRVDAAAGSPTLEWQREGIGPSFEDRDNAQTSVQLAAPFVLPWNARDVKQLRTGAELLQETGVQATRHEVSARVARNWLELAATLEALEVARGRLERLDQAVVLQTHRRDLGEVAGLDVVQLELERLRDAGRVRRLETEAAEARARLAELTGTTAATPVAGDLRSLTDLPYVLPAEAEVESAVVAGPLARAAIAAADVQNARAAVVADAAWGRPEAGVRWEHIPSLGGLPGFDAVGLRLSWPLPVGKAGRGRAAAANAEAAAAEAATAASLGELERRLRAALAAAAGAANVLSDAEPMLAKLGRAEHSLAEQFRLGAISYLVYIDGLSRLDEVRSEVITARLDLLEARVEVATILGGSGAFPLPEVTP